MGSLNFPISGNLSTDVVQLCSVYGIWSMMHSDAVTGDLFGAYVEAAPTQQIDQNRLMYFKGSHKL